MLLGDSRVRDHWMWQTWRHGGSAIPKGLTNGCSSVVLPHASNVPRGPRAIGWARSGRGAGGADGDALVEERAADLVRGARALGAGAGAELARADRGEAVLGVRAAVLGGRARRGARGAGGDADLGERAAHLAGATGLCRAERCRAERCKPPMSHRPRTLSV